MANQGYPDEGSDKRLLPGLGFVQKAGIVHGSTPTDVEQEQTKNWRFTWQSWPPMLMIEKKKASGGYKQLRLGWMWRKNEKYYIPGAAIKNEQGLEPDYTGLKDKE